MEFVEEQVNNDGGYLRGYENSPIEGNIYKLSWTDFVRGQAVYTDCRLVKCEYFGYAQLDPRENKLVYRGRFTVERFDNGEKVQVYCIKDPDI